MKIVADENLAFTEYFFSEFGNSSSSRAQFDSS
jgi:hypothetical protein